MAIKIAQKQGNVFLGLFNGKTPFSAQSFYFSTRPSGDIKETFELRKCLNLIQPSVYEMTVFPKLILSRPALWRLFNEPDTKHWSYKLTLPKTQIFNALCDAPAKKEFFIEINNNNFPINPIIDIYLNKNNKTAEIRQGVNKTQVTFKLFGDNIIELSFCEILKINGRLILTGPFNDVYHLSIIKYPKQIPADFILNNLKRVKQLDYFLSKTGLFDYFNFSETAEDKVAAALTAAGLLNPALHEK